MATTESFSNLVLLYKGSNNVYNSFSGSYTVNDSVDGNDGQTAVGDSVYFVQYGSSFPLVGTTANGVVVSGPVYNYLITDG